MWLMVTVELAVRGDHDQLALGVAVAVGLGLGEARHEPVADEGIRVDGRQGFERDRRRQEAVVDDDDHRPTISERDPVRPPRIDDPFDLPRGEDGVRDARDRPSPASRRGRRPSPAATSRPVVVRSAARNHAGPTGSRSAGRRPTPAAGWRGGTAGPCRWRRARRRRTRRTRPGRRSRASRPGSARGPTTSRPGCRPSHSADSSRRRCAGSSRARAPRSDRPA